MNSHNKVFEKLNDLGIKTYYSGSCIYYKVLSMPIDYYDVLIVNDTNVSTHEHLEKVLGKNYPKLITINKENHKFIDCGNDLYGYLTSRDFSIDSIAVGTLNSEIHDPMRGLSDIRQRLIKINDRKLFLSNPELMLRAVSLASQLGFVLNTDTWILIYDYASLVQSVSPEYIRDELIKIVMSEKPSAGIKMLKDSGLLEYIIPKLHFSDSVVQSKRDGVTNVFDHTMYALDNTPTDLAIRLTILFHDIGKADTMQITSSGQIHFFGHEVTGAEIARKTLTDLKFNPELVDKVSHLVKHHMFDIDPKMTSRGVRRLIKRVGAEHIWDLLKVREADRQGSPNKISMKKVINLKRKIRKELEDWT